MRVSKGSICSYRCQAFCSDPSLAFPGHMHNWTSNIIFR